MKICGFFWKWAATAMVGMLFCTARKSPIMSPPMKNSILPAIKSMPPFDIGPPWRIVTSRPYLA